MTLEEYNKLVELNEEINRKANIINDDIKKFDYLRTKVRDNNCYIRMYKQVTKRQTKYDKFQAHICGELSKESSLAFLSELRKLCIEDKNIELNKIKEQFKNINSSNACSMKSAEEQAESTESTE